MADPADGFTWTSNKTHLCYEHENEQHCGERDGCNGLLLPLVFEESWNPAFRAIVYLIGLLYSFLGVSIVADIFMCAIEKITSKTKQITIPRGPDDANDVIEVPVWNGTVANLTLMALGSSAPGVETNLFFLPKGYYVFNL